MLVDLSSFSSHPDAHRPIKLLPDLNGDVTNADAVLSPDSEVDEGGSNVNRPVGRSVPTSEA